MKTYLGERSGQDARVWIVYSNGRAEPLPWRLDLDNHSPTGLEWGYAGSGPAQLALAILADATGNDKTALRLHQQFKFKHIATLPRSQGWHMTINDVLAFVSAALA